MNRTVLVFLLGGWLLLTASMGFVASSTFRVVEPDDLRDADQVFADLDPGDERRMALRYVASEINRDLFSRYAVANVALAAACLVLLLREPRRPRGAVAALTLALIVAATFSVWFTPTIIEQGRGIDFVPRDPPPPEVIEFKRLHGLSMGAELLKLGLILGVAAGLARGAGTHQPREA